MFPKWFPGLSIPCKPNTTQLKEMTPSHSRNKVKEYLAKMKVTGVIICVKVPSDLCAGMVLVPKKNADLCCSPLGTCPSQDRYNASRAHVFSKVNVNSTFW